MTDPSIRPDEEVSPGAPSPDGEPAVTPDPFAAAAAAGGPGAPVGHGEPAITAAPGGGTILTDAAGLAAERDEYLADLQRLKAEFDNYRKRVARQQEEQSDRAAGALVGKLLPVLDNLDLAYTHLAGAHLTPGPAGAAAPPAGAGGPDAPVSEEARALLQAREQLLDALAKEGLARVDEVDVEFDPVVHDAVASVQSDSPADAGTGGNGGMAVDEVMRAGYRWRGQVLRPAMVRVRS